MEKALAGLVVAAGVSYLATPWVRRVAFRLGAVDRPDARKVHREPMPRLGGVAVYAAFVAAVIVAVPKSLEVLGLLLGLTLVTLVGVADDVRGLSPRLKLAGQVVSALALLPFGIEIYFVTNPLNGHLVDLGWLGLPLTVFWVVAVTNAVNLIDGLDGLAGGVSLIAALTMAAVGFVQWKFFGAADQQEVILLALLLAAALLGFLRHNFHPASIFLGDAGSMLLGYALAAMAVMGLTKSVTAVAVVLPLLILGIPLLDTFMAILRRYFNRRPIFAPDKEHLHHQLLALGLSHRQAVLTIYGVSALLGFCAVFLVFLAVSHALLLLAVLAAGIVSAASRLGLVGRQVGRKGQVKEM
ncbi:glycosyltransferase family 4 protein [Desulfovirgula thermocuniculi]|uniref:glycosyltransferase family 4 protein n=1 Tax=Desulfovirgula thermocuniculi TaxID=348842 RepID=UPI00042A637A|nr:MraY family glycosyltransferase [Desulfovirgula thermocuniculi]